MWRSGLIPNGPLVVRSALGPDFQKKLTDWFTAFPKEDAACFAAVEGGDFTGYVPVTSDTYATIIDTRKQTIGG